MSKLIIDFHRGWDEMALIKDFPVDTLHVHYEQVGVLLRYWRATLDIEDDVLSKEQFEWLLQEMRFIRRAVFETDSIGLIGTRGGSPFRVVMRGR